METTNVLGHKFHTSKCVKKSVPVQGRNDFDINRRMIIAMREIGRGFSDMETLCGFLNMPPLMSKTTYHDKRSAIHDAYIEVANTSMLDASVEVRQHLQGDKLMFFLTVHGRNEDMLRRMVL